MGTPIVIYGKSGSGKSRSLKFFSADEILLIKVEDKLLPFKNNFSHVVVTDNQEVMKQTMYTAAQNGCKTIVLDDLGLMMTKIFMANHRDKRGNKSFEMYDDIADSMYFLIDFVKKYLPPDVLVYFMLHEDTDDNGETKIKTIGKLLNGKAQIAEMMTICIRCLSKNGRHYFKTVTDGNDITKAPEDLFTAPEIDNNLKVVDETIRKFYGLEVKKDDGIRPDNGDVPGSDGE